MKMGDVYTTENIGNQKLSTDELLARCHEHIRLHVYNTNDMMCGQALILDGNLQVSKYPSPGNSTPETQCFRKVHEAVKWCCGEGGLAFDVSTQLRFPDVVNRPSFNQVLEYAKQQAGSVAAAGAAAATAGGRNSRRKKSVKPTPPITANALLMPPPAITGAASLMEAWQHQHAIMIDHQESVNDHWAGEKHDNVKKMKEQGKELTFLTP